jgi:TP901 family phage tail tape measure protein
MATVKALHIAIGARVEGFQRGMTKAQRSLRNFEKSTRRARGMVVGATGVMARGFAVMGSAAALAIGDSIRVFASFESSMLRVKAISGATGESFKSLTDLAKELGATTAFTAREAAQAMGFLAQAGFSVGEITKTLPKVLSLAAAGQLDLANAADITASVLRGFGLEATQSGRVADVLAASASKSNTSVEQMGEAFKFAGPVASAMGISIEETAAALGVLSNAGLKGSLAGTGLRMVLVKMGEDIANAGGLTQALKQLDTEGIRGVVQTMKDLDARAGTAAVALTGQMDVLRGLHGEMLNVEGISDKMAETMLSGVTGSAIKAGSAFESLRIKLGETFEQFGVGFFEEITRTFQALNDVIGDMRGQFGDLKTAGKDVAQTMLLVAESVGLAFTAIADTFTNIIGMMRTIALGQQMGLNVLKGQSPFKDTGAQMQKAAPFLEAPFEFKRTGKLEELILKLSAKLDPLTGGKKTTPAPGGGGPALNSFDVMSKFLSDSELKQIFPEKFPEQSAMDFEKFSPLGFGTDAPKAAADRPGGFTEGIQTALGMVKVDPTVAKKDSDNLDKIAKNTENMFREMLTGLESFS